MYCLLHLIKLDCLLKYFLRTLILMAQVSLRFPSRTNLKLHNISVTPKMVKNVMTNLNSSKVSGPDCIPVVVLNCNVNMCLMESCFSDYWKVSSVVTGAAAFDISKTFGRIWNADLLHKLKSYGISGQIFGFISSFLSN